MRRTTVAAAVAAATGLTLLATPVLASGVTGTGAAFRRPTATCMNDTIGMNGMNGTAGPGARRGYRGMAGDPATNLPAKGTLTTAQKQSLAAMAEEEKLAHDVYTALASTSGDARFTRIAASEQRHLDAVRVLLGRYAVNDPTAGKAAGTFSTPTAQSLYSSLVAKGSASDAAALEVGRTIERTDIADLRKVSAGLDAADVSTVYQRLLKASQHHLAAFGD